MKEEKEEKEASSVPRQRERTFHRFTVTREKEREKKKREDEIIEWERPEGGRAVCTIGECRVKFIHLTKSSSLPVCSVRIRCTLLLVRRETRHLSPHWHSVSEERQSQRKRESERETESEASQINFLLESRCVSSSSK